MLASRLRHLPIMVILALVVGWIGVSCRSRSSSGECLERIETFVESHPDSALHLLDSLAPALTPGSREQALHTILTACARNYLRLPVGDDSLLRESKLYFDASSDTYHAMLANLYYSRVLLHELEKRQEALEPAVTSLRLALELGVDSNIARGHSLMADINYSSFNYDEELKHRRKAVEIYKRTGDRRRELLMYVDIAHIYDRRHLFGRAISMLDSVLGVAMPDTLVYVRALDATLSPLVNNREYSKAISRYGELISFVDQEEMSGYTLSTISMAHTCVHDKEKGQQFLDMAASSLANASDSVSYFYSSYLLNIEEGEVEKARTCLWTLFRFLDSTLLDLHEVSPAMVERDIFHSQAKQNLFKAERYKYIGIALAILIVIGGGAVGYLYATRWRRRESAIEKTLGHMYVRANRILDDESMQSEHRHLDEMWAGADKAADGDLVADMFRQLFAGLNNLALKYSEAKGNNNPRSKKQLYQEIEHELSLVSSMERFPELESIVNRCRGGIVEKLRAQVPSIDESEVSFLTLFFANLSVEVIAVLRDMTINGVYSKRRRLRMKILESDAPDKELFISALGGHSKQ